MVVFDEPADKIIEIARDEGIVISRRELSEWHRCGLIRKPRQLHLGQGKGSGTIYPRGTARQAITCAVLMAHLRSKRKVGWELWVRGYPVAERYWRAPFKRALKAFRSLSSYFADSADPTDGVPALSDQADEFFSEVALRPKAPKGWGIARRRLGQKRFEDLLAIILSTAIGSFEVSEDGASGPASPTRILARLLGVEAGLSRCRRSWKLPGKRWWKILPQWRRCSLKYLGRYQWRDSPKPYFRRSGTNWFS